MSDAPVVTIDPTPFRDDPYPTLAVMRAETPICFVPSLTFGAGPHVCAGAAASRSLVGDHALPRLRPILPYSDVAERRRATAESRGRVGNGHPRRLWWSGQQ